MRRAVPTRPLKNSQLARPAALAMTFTRRAICDSDNPKTLSLLATPASIESNLYWQVKRGAGQGCYADW